MAVTKTSNASDLQPECGIKNEASTFKWRTAFDYIVFFEIRIQTQFYYLK